jgi:hypothetical protein
MVTNPIDFLFYSGDGETTDFSYVYNGTAGFDIVDGDTVKAAILNPDGTRDLDPNFAVLKDAYNNYSGFVRFSVAPVAGAVIYLYRETPETQENNWKNASSFSAISITKAFDKVVRLIQEVFFHAQHKTLQMDEFQQEVFQVLLTSQENDGQLMWVDWENKTIKYTSFERGQVVVSVESGEDGEPKYMLRTNYYTTTDRVFPFLEYSEDGGTTWYPVSGADVAFVFGMWLDAFGDVFARLPEGGVAIPGIIKRNGKLYGTFFDSGINPATTGDFPLIEPATINGNI